MNRRQLWGLCFGLAVAASMVAYRPWRVETWVPPDPRERRHGTRVLDMEIWTVYDWCWKPAGECPGDRYPPPGRLWPKRHPDNELLLVQILAWSCLVLVAFIRARSPQRAPDRLDKRTALP